MTLLPSKTVAGYWPDTNSGQPLASVHANYNVINVAFARGQSTTSGLLHLQPPSQGTASLQADIATKQAAGVKIILSIGGANDINGTSKGYTLSTSTQQTECISTLNSLISTYNFDGIDWDLESPFTFTNAAIVNVVSSLKGTYPNLLVTLAPESFDVLNASGRYRTLATSLGGNLSAIGGQYYNHSSTPAAVMADMLAGARACISQYGANRTMIGYMATDDNGVHVSAVQMKSVWDTLHAESPDICGAYIWETNLDKNNATDGANAFALTVGNDILASPGSPGGGAGGGGGGTQLPPNFW